jgi:hypothetical protein
MKRLARLKLIAPFILIGGILAATMALADGPAGGTSAAGASGLVDSTRLPIGDGKVSKSGPRKGYVYSCQTDLPAGPGGPGGAKVEGPWIKSDGTFDATAKPTVDGSVKWKNAKLKKKVTKKKRTITGNGLPRGTKTGEFPVSSSDDAFQYDPNPNSISEQSVRDSLPRHPKRAKQASCLPMGAIGIAKNGVAIFNALDALERDAVAHEVQDECSGHPERSGTYHYHDIPDCLTKGESTDKASGLVGWALDGYPIFGPRGHGGRLLTNDDLDACHGQKSKVYYEGRWQKIYHYNATLEYPYTLGCFRGTPTEAAGRQ